MCVNLFIYVVSSNLVNISGMLGSVGRMILVMLVSISRIVSRYKMNERFMLFSMVW